jgi:hypothetical protein
MLGKAAGGEAEGMASEASAIPSASPGPALIGLNAPALFSLDIS